jgi:hypothetical protein
MIANKKEASSIDKMARLLFHYPAHTQKFICVINIINLAIAAKLNTSPTIFLNARFTFVNRYRAKITAAISK